MGKMSFTSFFKSKETNTAGTSPSWPWPSCNHPKTLSFRAGDDIYKTINSIYFDSSFAVDSPESWFTNSTDRGSFSTESEGLAFGEQLNFIRSDRFFFEPGETKLICDQEAKAADEEDGVVVVTMESEDPKGDFRRSMEEMVEAHGLREDDWECLEELLLWYLSVNGKKTHGFIVGAFVDLLVGIVSSSPSFQHLSDDESDP